MPMRKKGALGLPALPIPVNSMSSSIVPCISASHDAFSPQYFIYTLQKLQIGRFFGNNLKLRSTENPLILSTIFPNLKRWID